MNNCELSVAEYQFILRNDFSSFIERAFIELNPQTDFMTAPYIDLLASALEGCRTGRDETTNHQPPATDVEVPRGQRGLPGVALRPRSHKADHLRELWAGSGRQTCSRLENSYE